jgi:hypothetical protein
MRFLLLPLLATVSLPVCAIPSAAQLADGTCDSPIDLSDSTDVAEFTFDTTTRSNNELGCEDAPATGPDVVLWFNGLPVQGFVTWTADFDAVVYYRRENCESMCVSSSRNGTLEFSSNYRWESHDGDLEVMWESPFIIVDGVAGAAGVISVTINYGVDSPTLKRSWGNVKNSYRQS